MPVLCESMLGIGKWSSGNSGKCGNEFDFHTGFVLLLKRFIYQMIKAAHRLSRYGGYDEKSFVLFSRGGPL